MHRRSLLASAGIPFSTYLAGCIVGRVDSAGPIDISESTVKQGETAVIHIEAENLTGLRISEFPEEFPSERLTLGEATFDPSPKASFDVFPPYWKFSGDDVVGEIPIQTSPETLSDTYQFTFAVELEGEDEKRSVLTAVTVETDSN